MCEGPRTLLWGRVVGWLDGLPGRLKPAADDDAVVPFDAALALADKKTTTRRCRLTQPPSTPSTRRLLMAWPRAHVSCSTDPSVFVSPWMRSRLRRKLILLGDVGGQGMQASGA